MDRWAAKNKEATENQFQRLTDDIVLNIFDKLSDIQCLCRCFVVSKRFSSLIPLVRTVSIRSKTWKSKYDHRGTFPLGRLSEALITDLVFRPLRELHNRSLFPSSHRDVSGVVFLSKLTHVQALNIELPSNFVADNDSVSKWGAKFTPHLDSVTFLYASSLSKMIESEQQQEESESESESEEEEEEEEEMEHGITNRERNRRVVIAIECIKDAVLWLGILCFVSDCPLSRFPMLQSVTITDSKKKGAKLCLSGEKLAECRNTFRMSRMHLLFSMGWPWTLENMRVGYVPVLHLPMSKYVMKGVTIVNYKMFADDDYDAYKAMVEAFAEEQDVFSEAVVQIQEKHKDCMINLLF